MKRIVENFSNLSIAVIGDVMLDIFTYGLSNRLSPEAPVPIIRINDKVFSAGGAGNVSNNLQALGVKSYIFGVVGNDQYAKTLQDIFEKNSITTFLSCDPTRSTTVKERFIVGNQQLLRVDSEVTEKISESIENEIMTNLKNLVAFQKIDAIIISDYNKGTVSDSLVKSITKLAKEYNIITALDPKPNSLKDFSNLTVLKPNRQETFSLANMEDDFFADRTARLELLTRAAKIISEKYQPENLVISLSADGIAIYKDEKLNVIPTVCKEVFDVSGAGDTLIGTLVSALSYGATIEESTLLANIASGIVVSKIGTASVTQSELSSALS